MKTRSFGNATMYTFENKNGMVMEVTDFGAVLYSLMVPDKDGNLVDVNLGYATPEAYGKETSGFGATIGRNGNRIGGAKFTLNGKVYELAPNDNGNNLHSGLDFYQHRMWTVKETTENSIVFSLHSPDGDQGFPGNFDVDVTYTLTDDNELKIDYNGVTDADTVINMTNHSYFNLNGHASGNILEQIKTQRLLEELRTVKSSNAAEIRRLKKELASLRKVMVGYINQIDSLNRLTAQQKKIIADVTKKYNAASQKINTLNEEKENLTKTVTLAAQLDATNINITAQNKRGKITKKVKDVVKFKIDFTIVKNITAVTGERILYIRINKPDNDVLTKDPSSTFAYENRQLPYSIKKYIEYNGEEQNVTVYWDVEEFLHAGDYRVDIFSDGNLIGSTIHSLK